MSVSNRALLIVDHGSRNANANEAIAGFAERVAAARPDWRIAHAHMELAQPDVPSTIEQLVGEGVSEIHIYLHFLGRGFHVRETIPELVDAAHERHPGLRVTVSDPIGEHPKLVELVLETLPDLDG